MPNKKNGDGGVPVSVRSKTSWTQTPTSYAVDKRKFDREWKKLTPREKAKLSSQGRLPSPPPRVGSTASIKRKTRTAQTKKGTVTRWTQDYRGPSGMIPNSLKRKKKK